MKISSLYPYVVTDKLDASVRFYTETMDFTVRHNAVRADGGRVVILANPAGLQLELMEPLETGAPGLKAGDSGLRMNVADVEAAAEELRRQGCTVPEKVIETKLGKNLLIQSPDGTKITLIQHIHKEV